MRLPTVLVLVTGLVAQIWLSRPMFSTSDRKHDADTVTPTMLAVSTPVPQIGHLGEVRPGGSTAFSVLRGDGIWPWNDPSAS